MNITHKFKIEETEYTLQKLPVMEALKLRDRCKNGADMDSVKFYTELLEHVVISPKNLSLNSFDDVSDVEELMKEVIKFQYGKREKKQQSKKLKD